MVDEGSHDIALVMNDINPSESENTALNTGSTIIRNPLITSGPPENQNASQVDNVTLHEVSARHKNTTGPW